MTDDIFEAGFPKSLRVNRGWYAVTEFERAASVNFQKTLELSRRHPGFAALIDERSIVIYRNVYRKEDLLEFQAMVKLIKNWRGTKLYLNGERIEADGLGAGISCFIHTVLSQGATAAQPEQCRIFSSAAAAPRGCVGCRRSRMSMAWDGAGSPDAPVWFAFGHLDANLVYHIHREDLENAVISELLEYEQCPLLDLEGARRFLRSLPKRIDPRKDREWAYRRRQAASAATFDPRAALREPAVLPVSPEAYLAYLRRKGFVTPEAAEAQSHSV